MSRSSTVENVARISTIEMGARPYVPGLGRFLEVDPIEGGCSNDYTYVGDPVNQFDLDGRSCDYNSKVWQAARVVSLGGVVRADYWGARAAGSWSAGDRATARREASRAVENGIGAGGSWLGGKLVGSLAKGLGYANIGATAWGSMVDYGCSMMSRGSGRRSNPRRTSNGGGRTGAS